MAMCPPDNATLQPNTLAQILHLSETGGQPKTARYLADLIRTTLHPFSP